jgi:hypothetical protein
MRYFCANNKVRNSPIFWFRPIQAKERFTVTKEVEGLVSIIESQVNALSGEIWELWLDLNYRVASDPCIHGCVEHLLVVARKPR